MKNANNEATIKVAKEVVIKKLPKMMSIQEVMNETGFSYRHLWMLCKTNKIVHIRAGAKYLINFDKFIDYLNSGDFEEQE